MNSPKPVISRVSTLLIFAAFSLTAATNTNADSDSTTTAYIDSIHQWGAWELDIEPAAGGLQQPSTQALNARDSRVTLRTNSIAALSPAIPAVPAIPATPTTPAVPAISAVPAITPISPSVPIPVGGPNNGF